MGARLSIVFVAPFGLAHKTTVWARTLPIAQRLVASGHRATILIPPWDSPEDAGAVAELDGVRVEQMALSGGTPAVVWRMLRRIGDLEPDIVHVVKPRAHAGLVQWWLWQRPRRVRPVLILDTDDWEQAWAPINRYSWSVARFLAWQEEWGIRHADGITAASHWLVDRVRCASPAMPTLYLPNGVSPLSHQGRDNRQEISSSPRVLFFSRFVEVPPDWLARFWAALLALLPEAELAIAGEPVAPGLDEPFRRALATMPAVHWLGYVPSDNLRALYDGSACAIFPATPVPLHQAKCSVRLATTLLHGVPVVASAVGEQAVYGSAGAARLVAADAPPERFAQDVAQVLASPAQRIALQTAAQAQLLARYNWTLLVASLEEFYGSVCERQT